MEANEYLASKIQPNKCYHLFDIVELICTKCNKYMKTHKPLFKKGEECEDNPKYDTQKGFWEVWQWATKQEWWEEFVIKKLTCPDSRPDGQFNYHQLNDFINYNTFAQQVASWAMWKERKEH